MIRHPAAAAAEAAPRRRLPVPRIALDAGCVVGPRSGIGGYTASLLDALGRAWPANWPQPIAWVNSPRHPLPENDAWLRGGAFDVRHTKYSGKALLRAWQWLGWPAADRWLGPLDLIHSPAGVPMIARRARRALTVFDVYFKHRLEHTNAYGGKYFAATYDKRLPRMDKIFCISDFTRRELARFYRLDQRRIQVIAPGIDTARFHPHEQAGDAAAREAAGARGNYLLGVGTHEPRKNYGKLIEAMAKLKKPLEERGLELPQLVIVGGEGWGRVELAGAARRAGVEKNIKLAGYLPDEAMPALYRGALAFVFPTLYEGFGLPALEAMACGCPCALSRIEALEEVAGDAAAWFDPNDAAGIAQLLVEVIDGEDLRIKLRERGLERARKFSWAAAARDTLDAYRELLMSSRG